MGGQALLFASAGNAAFPGPNGKLAYSEQVTENGSGQFKIFVQNPDGTGKVSLSVAPAQDFEPTWSRDGTRIAFSADVPNKGRQIGVMNADGTNRIIITGGPGQQDRGAGPAWSPAGNKIVFSRPAFGGIYVMNADGTSPTALSTNGSDGEPAWSPDGQRIAFVRSGNIYTMNADGSGVQALTTVPNNARFGNPDWSPNGSTLVVSCADGPGTSICMMNADGTGLATLTSSQADFIPVWSPQGDQIAFERFTNARQDVWIINADGTNGHSLSGSPSGYPNGISWGPVGPSGTSTTTSTSTSTSTTSASTSTTSTFPPIITTTTALPGLPVSIIETVCPIMRQLTSLPFIGPLIGLMLRTFGCPN